MSDIGKLLLTDIDELITVLNKKFGKKVLMRASDMKYEAVSIGIPILDYVLGGGIPRGRLIQIYGTFNSGKTMIALKAIVAAQKRGERCAFIDAEKTYDKNWAIKLGVDNKKLYISRPSYGERALDIMESLIVPDMFSIVVLDSIASLVPLVELESKMEDQQMGVAARMMNKALRKLTAVNKNTIILMINQVREKLGILYGSPLTRPGGRGLDYISTMLINVKRGQWIEYKKKRIGHYVICDITKNKVAPPQQTCSFPFYYDGSIDNAPQYIQVALDLGYIKSKSAGWYEYEGTKYHGIKKLKKEIIKNKDLITKLDKEITKGIKYIRNGE